MGSEMCIRDRSKTSTTTKTATARGRRLEDVACGRMLKRVGRGLWPKATGQQLWGSLRLQLAAGLRPPHPLSDGSSRISYSMLISLASQNTIFQWSISAAKSTGRFRRADGWEGVRGSHVFESNKINAFTKIETLEPAWQQKTTDNAVRCFRLLLLT